MNMRRSHLVQLILLIFLATTYLFLTRSSTCKNEEDALRPDMKQILYWTGMWDLQDFELGFGSEIFENCSYQNCYTTCSRSHIPIDQFDAIVFHAVEYGEFLHGKPARRHPRQRYVFGNLEAPPETPESVKFYNNFYNWTMTYRSDSDIPRPYGSFRQKSTKYQPPSAEEIQRRPKKIAWFVSHCSVSSHREEVVNELSEILPVDVYGKCGNLTCSRRDSEACYEMLESDYKFYLAFENAVCEDYLTEKVFNVLKRNVVPIAYGGGDYRKLVPPNSVINLMDFKTVKELAEYVRYLDEHTEEYLKFFEWKRDYVIDTSKTATLCTLCQKLNEDVEPKSYSDVALWWWGGQKDAKCEEVHF